MWIPLQVIIQSSDFVSNNYIIFHGVGVLEAIQPSPISGHNFVVIFQYL